MSYERGALSGGDGIFDSPWDRKGDASENINLPVVGAATGLETAAAETAASVVQEVSNAVTGGSAGGTVGGAVAWLRAHPLIVGLMGAAAAYFGYRHFRERKNPSGMEWVVHFESYPSDFTGTPWTDSIEDLDEYVRKMKPEGYAIAYRRAFFDPKTGKPFSSRDRRFEKVTYLDGQRQTKRPGTAIIRAGQVPAFVLDSLSQAQGLFDPEAAFPPSR